MSVKVDFSKGELTDGERQYLLERGRAREVRAHDRRRGYDRSTAPPAGTQGHETSVEQREWQDYVDALNVEELREELSERNMDTEGRKAVLVDRLKTAGPNT